ncbi:MAG: DUF1643 domain-containing protein [Cyanophyceae cyanobacterium]
MFDIYRCDAEDRHRFVIGKQGKLNLLVLGLNPSKANQNKSDVTISKIGKAALSNGFDGFIVANLYSLRSTNPKELPQCVDMSLVGRNAEIIASSAKKYGAVTFWAAWGGDIKTREYLRRSLSLIANKVRSQNICWLHFGPLRKDGHPRHPSRLSYAWTFQTFDIDSYLLPLI